MRRWLLIIILTCMGLAEAQPQIKRYDTDFTVSAKVFSCTLPIEVERHQVYLPVEIGGRTYRFKLDTGASQGTIYDDVPIKGLRELGYINSTDATGHSQQVKTVLLPPFGLGPITISGYKVQRMHRNVVRKGEDGIIGFALFNKGLAAKIDTREGVLRLTDRREYFQQEQGEALKYQLRSHVPYIKISPFAGVEEEVLFDSGSPMLYAVNSQSLSNMQARNPNVAQQIEGTTYGSQTIGHFGTERSGRITLLALDRLRWGTFDFLDVHCSTVNGGSHVGARLLDYGSLIINPFRRQLIFQPYDDTTSCTVGNRQHDIVIVAQAGKAAIGMVREQGRAWTAGFRSGYIIELVNGQPLTFEQFITFRWIVNQSYTFTLRHPSGRLTTVKALWPLQYNREE